MITTVKTTKSHFTMNNEAATAPPSRIPIVIAARRLRPALGPATAGGSSTKSALTSDLEEFDFLVSQHLVDLCDIAMRQVVEFLLRTMDVVLTRLAALLKLVERFLRMAPDVADRDSGVLGLAAGKFDVLATTLLGELRDADADHVAVVRRIHAKVGVADRLLDCA